MAHFTVIFKSLAPQVAAGFGNQPEAELIEWAKNQNRFPKRNLTQLPLRRQLEHWCVDQCLTALGLAVEQIVHDSNGKPLVQNHPDRHLSIAHHSGAEGCWASVALADASIGIDIETEREQLRRIASRFLHPNEQAAIGDDVAYLSMAWAVKECMFKAHGPALDFREDLRLRWPGLAAAQTAGIEGAVRGTTGQYRLRKLTHPDGLGTAWLAFGPVY